MIEPANTHRPCPTCGSAIPANAPDGLCPRCLLGGGSAIFDSPGEATGDHPSRAAAAPADMQGLFPELEVGELLGKGGMGAVYRARQPRLDRDTALKVLACPPEHHEAFALRFEREAQTLARLNHPNIVTLFDFGERDGLFYFLMEFVDGTDLNQLIRGGELEPAQALRIVPQICDALQYAHDAGITHRDIKPANILIDRDGQVKVADFGLAKVIGNDNEAMVTGLTLTGTSMGTPHYMAPEQWDSPEKVDHRSDIYSLGVVFYEMLTGERPAGVFDPPSQTAGVDARLDTIVLHSMEKAPDRRYQRAGQVKEDVTQVVNSPRRQHASRSRRWWISAVGAVVVIGLLLVLAKQLWLPSEGTKSGENAAATRSQGDSGRDGSRTRPATPTPRSPGKPPQAKLHRLVIVPTDPTAREQCPGAPWEVAREDLVDLQLNSTHLNEHRVNVALTSGGKLLDWINRIPGKSILPNGLRDAEVAQFCLNSGDNRSVAMLKSGEILTWIWSLDPENQEVTVSEPEKLLFTRPDRPAKLRATGYNGIFAVYDDGGVEVDPPGLVHFDRRPLEGMAGVKDIGNFLAHLQDGTLVDVLGSQRPPGKPLMPLPLAGVRLLRASPYFPTALLEDGTLWYWNENHSDAPGRNFFPTLKRAETVAPVADFRSLQSGDVYYAVKNESGDWHVSHGDLHEEQRAQLKGAPVVFRDKQYVIGLMQVGNAG